MKREKRNVRCKSGLWGWQDRLRGVYKDLDEFRAYSETYSIAQRIGYKTPEAAWKANPLIRGSVEPSDLERAPKPRVVKFRWCGVMHEVELPKGARAAYNSKNKTAYALYLLRLNLGKGGEIFYMTKDRFLVVFQYGERWYDYAVRDGYVYAHGRRHKIGGPKLWADGIEIESAKPKEQP